MATLAPHQPRPVRFMRDEELGDWRLKLYGIALPGKEPRPELVDAALSAAADALPQDATGEGRRATGFVIVHDAATVCFGLVYWWQADNELHQRCFVSPLDDPAALAPIENPAAGCVWELEVIDFERRAWLADVLANPDGPAVERYLTRRFNGEV